MTTSSEVAARALELIANPDQAAVDELVDLSGGQRAPLEEASRIFIGRLRRRSDDFDATRALRLLSRAIATVGWPSMSPPAAARRKPSLLRRLIPRRHRHRRERTHDRGALRAAASA